MDWKSEENLHPPEPLAIENHVIDIAWKEANAARGLTGRVGYNKPPVLPLAEMAETCVFQLTFPLVAWREFIGIFGSVLAKILNTSDESYC